MKTALIFVLSAVCCLPAFASEGTIQAAARENTLYLTIFGDAAVAISKQLAANGIPFRRHPVTGAVSQSGRGIRCAEASRAAPLRCLVSITGYSVN